MARLRLGVIGAGAWAMAQHLPAFAAHPDEIEPLIVNRRDPALLRECQDRFGFERATTDWQEVIEARPDLVVIASSASGHYEQAKAALRAGAHVLCEKPFVFRADEAWDLVETAAANDRHLMIAYGYNHMPINREARRLMTTEGGIGEIEQTSIHMASHIRDLLRSGQPYLGDKPEQAPRHDTWGDPATSGGGYGQGQLTHTLALALWLTDLRAAEVFSFMYTPEGLPVEFHDALSVRYTNGGVGSVAGAACHQHERFQVQVRAIGRDGQIHVDLERELLWRFRPGRDDIRVPITPELMGSGFPSVVNDFIDLAAGRTTENTSPGELGARVVEVLEAAHRSSASRSIATVDTALGRDFVPA
jgi:predicted dehydrogenase